MNLCLKKLRIKFARTSNGNEHQQYKIMNIQIKHGQNWKLMQNFTIPDGNIKFYLILYDKQMKKVQIKEEDWVAHLLGTLPLEVSQIIAKELEENYNNYDYVKKILLKIYLN